MMGEGWRREGARRAVVARREMLARLFGAAPLATLLGCGAFAQTTSQSARKGERGGPVEFLSDYAVVWTGLEALEVGKHKDRFWLFRIDVRSESGKELGWSIQEFTIPKRTKGPEMHMETSVRLPAEKPKATVEIKAMRGRTSDWECTAHGQLQLDVPIEVTLAMPKPKDGMFRLSFVLKRDEEE